MLHILFTFPGPNLQFWMSIVFVLNLKPQQIFRSLAALKRHGSKHSSDRCLGCRLGAENTCCMVDGNLHLETNDTNGVHVDIDMI